MAGPVTLSATDLERMIDRAPQATINACLRRINDNEYGPVCTVLMPLHAIIETPEVEVSYHARLLAAQKKSKTTVQKKWAKMIVAMDKDGTGVALVFDNSATLSAAIKQFDNAFEIGRAVTLVPSRCVPV